MRIRWTSCAFDDLEGIFNYLINTSPNLARPTIFEIREAIRSLKKLPNRGRLGKKPGTRELLHQRLPFIISYRTKEDVVEILRILHPSRDRS